MPVVYQIAANQGELDVRIRAPTNSGIGGQVPIDRETGQLGDVSQVAVEPQIPA